MPKSIPISSSVKWGEEIQHSDSMGRLLTFFERPHPAEYSMKCKRIGSSERYSAFNPLSENLILLIEHSCLLYKCMLATIYVDSHPPPAYIFIFTPIYIFSMEWSEWVHLWTNWFSDLSTASQLFVHLKHWDSFQIGFDQGAPPPAPMYTQLHPRWPFQQSMQVQSKFWRKTSENHEGRRKM